MGAIGDPSARLVAVAIVSAAAGALGTWLLLRSDDSRPALAEADEAVEPEAASSVAPVTRCPTLPVPAPARDGVFWRDGGAPAAAARPTSEDTERGFRRLTMHVRAAVRQMQSDDGRSDESIANDLHLYVLGWGDGVASTGADSDPELRAALRRATCDAQSDAERLLLIRIAATSPGLADSDAFECALGALHEQDGVLAGVLDAYRSARVAPTPSFLAWQRSATDPGIVRRFGGLPAVPPPP